MKQRAVIAMDIALYPRLIVADEQTTAFNPSTWADSRPAGSEIRGRQIIACACHSRPGRDGVGRPPDRDLLQRADGRGRSGRAHLGKVAPPLHEDAPQRAAAGRQVNFRSFPITRRCPPNSFPAALLPRAAPASRKAATKPYPRSRKSSATMVMPAISPSEAPPARRPVDSSPTAGAARHHPVCSPGRGHGSSGGVGQREIDAWSRDPWTLAREVRNHPVRRAGPAPNSRTGLAGPVSANPGGVQGFKQHPASR